MFLRNRWRQGCRLRAYMDVFTACFVRTCFPCFSKRPKKTKNSKLIKLQNLWDSSDFSQDVKMAFKPSENKDELCYPFIYEQSYLCDFEVATDELCNHLGAVLAKLPDELKEVKQDLYCLQPLVYHLNGSIRGRLAIKEEQLSWLLSRYRYYKDQTRGYINGFVLPQGPEPIPQLHLARSASKKAIRFMVRIDQEGKAVDPILLRFCNVLCNFLFVLAVYLAKNMNFSLIPFTSKSY